MTKDRRPRIAGALALVLAAEAGVCVWLGSPGDRLRHRVGVAMSARSSTQADRQLVREQAARKRRPRLLQVVASQSETVRQRVISTSERASVTQDRMSASKPSVPG